MPEQQALLEMPTVGEEASPPRPLCELPPGNPPVAPAPKYRRVERNQTTVGVIDVEELIGQDHKARAIWALMGQLDLSRFGEQVKSKEGEAGRPAWDPRLLCSVWLYGYSEGITSARELERVMEYEPGLRWLTGLGSINHHTLSDFRVERKPELDELFVQLLVAMEEAKLVSLERVMHDGTKVRARAGVDTFRREATVKERLEKARELVQEDPQGEGGKRREAAQQRAGREREQRLKEALEELQKIQSSKGDEEEKKQARVSLSEPEARMMKHGDGGIAPSYNLQVSTDAAQGVIVGVELSQNSNDAKELDGAVEEVKRNLGREPEQVVADGGFINRDSIEKMEERGVDLIGPMGDPRERSEAAMKASGIDPQYAPHFFIWDADSSTLQCPAGKSMKYVGGSQKRGNQYRQYRAEGGDCVPCRHQQKCCPREPEKGRMVSRLEKEQEVVARFREKMKTAEAQQIYRQRGAVAEFPFAQLKERFGVRKFRVFGKWKAEAEAMWACLAHNVMIWVRLCWHKAVVASAAAVA
ncbi:MAG: IS1182 family transposase [Acidobacteria bacterium]|nr:IS1182 family transposase [Acidobacteriota bacterium]